MSWRGLAAVTALAFTWATSASAQTVFLACKPPPNLMQTTIYVTIDYDAGTAQISQGDSTDPVVDSVGRSDEPAQVTNSSISWILVERCSPRAKYPCRNHYQLNRLTGDLSIFLEAMQHTFSFHCEPSERPKPKF